MEEQRKKEEERREAQKKKQEMELQRQQDAKRKAALNIQHVKVNFGDGEAQHEGTSKPKTRQEYIEVERQKAEEKLKLRMERARKAAEVAKKHNVQLRRPKDEEPLLPANFPALATDTAQEAEGKSFGGYNDLHGEIRTVTVTKAVRRLGIAIDGGANTRQKAVIIREISVSIA